MRAWFGVLAFTFASCLLFAADVRDLGVPAGWRASDYDRHGYDLLNKGNYDGARRYLDAAIRTDPYMWTAYYNRAMTFCQQKNWAAALQDLNATIRLKPSFFLATLDRSSVYHQLRNYRASLADSDSLVRFASSVRDELGQALALNQRAWVRATCPDGSMRNAQLAVADAKRACELVKWKHAAYIDTLAAAYAEAGDFDSAVRYEQQAIAVNQSESQNIAGEIATGMSKKIAQRLADATSDSTKLRSKEFPQRLELYKQHRPYRDTRSD
jgi:tetratricopeptide (TPR) repeat protein